MTRRFSTALFLVSLAVLPALAPSGAGLAIAGQRSRRAAPGKKEESSIEVTRAIIMRVTITTEAPKLFDYLADAKKLEEWFPDRAVFEPQPGGKYHFRWNEKKGVWSGMVTDFIRGNTLGYTWKPPDSQFETNLKFKLSPQGNETVLDLTQSGFTSNAEMDKEIKAWTFYLQNLKSVIEEGTDLRERLRPKSSRRSAPSSKR